MVALYGMIFVLLMIIDWTQVSLNGGIWAMTVNGIGLLLCTIIAGLLPWKNCRKREYFIWAVCWFVSSLIGFAIWKQDVNHVLEGQFITAALNVGFIGIIVIRYWQEGIFLRFIRKKEKKVQLLFAVWTAMTLWMCVSPQKSLWQIWFWVLFSLFYLLPLNEVQKSDLVKSVLHGIVAGFFVLQSLAYGFRPYDEVRYKGFFSNCNNNALMYLLTYTAVLTLILDLERQKKCSSRIWRLCFYYILAGGLLGFQLMTMTRTVLIMDAVVTICFLGVKVVQYLRTGKRNFHLIGGLLGRGIMLAGLMVLLFPTVFCTVRYLPAILHRPVWFLSEYSPERVHSFDPYNSYKYVDFSEFMATFLGRFSIELSEPLQESAEELLDSLGMSADIFAENSVSETEDSIGETASVEADESTAIRLKIYERYLKNLNMTGHTRQEGMYQITKDYRAYHAHNVFLQMFYTYGIPAGFLFVVLTAMLGIRLIYAFLRNPFHSWTIFRGFVYLVFFGFGMLEMTWNTGQITLFLLFFAQKELENSFEQEIDSGS